MTFSLAIQLTIFYWLYFETFLKIKTASVPYHNIVLIIISPLISNCDTNNTFFYYSVVKTTESYVTEVTFK